MMDNTKDCDRKGIWVWMCDYSSSLTHFQLIKSILPMIIFQVVAMLIVLKTKKKNNLILNFSFSNRNQQFPDYTQDFFCKKLLLPVIYFSCIIMFAFALRLNSKKFQKILGKGLNFMLAAENCQCLSAPLSPLVYFVCQSTSMSHFVQYNYCLLARNYIEYQTVFGST